MSQLDPIKINMFKSSIESNKNMLIEMMKERDPNYNAGEKDFKTLLDEAKNADIFLTISEYDAIKDKEETKVGNETLKPKMNSVNGSLGFITRWYLISDDKVNIAVSNNDENYDLKIIFNDITENSTIQEVNQKLNITAGSAEPTETEILKYKYNFLFKPLQVKYVKFLTMDELAGISGDDNALRKAALKNKILEGERFISEAGVGLSTRAVEIIARKISLKIVNENIATLPEDNAEKSFYSDIKVGGKPRNFTKKRFMRKLAKTYRRR